MPRIFVSLRGPFQSWTTPAELIAQGIFVFWVARGRGGGSGDSGTKANSNLVCESSGPTLYDLHYISVIPRFRYATLRYYRKTVTYYDDFYISNRVAQ